MILAPYHSAAISDPPSYATFIPRPYSRDVENMEVQNRLSLYSKPAALFKVDLVHFVCGPEKSTFSKPTFLIPPIVLSIYLQVIYIFRETLK